MINWRTRAHQRHTETINGTDRIVEPSSFSRESGWSGRHACGLLMAGGDRIRGAKRPRSGARVGPAAARSHGLRSPCPWRLSGASRAGGLHRGVSARLAAGRLKRLPQRRGARSQGAWRPDRPVSGRKLRVGLQLARWRGTEGRAADGARAGVELDRDQPVRHKRVRRLVPAGRHRAAARHELRHRHCGDGGGLRRVLQCRARDEVERAATVARLRQAAQRALLVPRQRDGRSVADRPDASA